MSDSITSSESSTPTWYDRDVTQTELEQGKEDLKEWYLDRVFHRNEPPPRALTRREIHRSQMAEANGNLPVDSNDTNEIVEDAEQDNPDDPDEADRYSK